MELRASDKICQIYTYRYIPEYAFFNYVHIYNTCLQYTLHICYFTFIVPRVVQLIVLIAVYLRLSVTINAIVFLDIIHW
jgi:hypothetical protein